MKQRIARAALAGATAAIQQEYPMHRIEVITDEPLSRQIRVSHPTAMQGGPRYFVIKVSEPI